MIELRKISQEELNEILDKHRKWLNQEDGGERANLDHASLKYASLNGANLNGASLDHASLKYASLNGASLDHASLNGANLNGASLDHASLKYASLNGASLDHASLKYASLKYASLNGASLDHASLDYSAWPLWCGSLDAKIDDRITIQLLYHTLSAALKSEYVSKEIKDSLIPLLPIANRFHCVDECGVIQPDGTREKQ